MKLFPAILLILLSFPSWPAHAQNDAVRRSPTITFYLENDAFLPGGTDCYYTHGSKVSWVSQDLSDYRDHPRISAWNHLLIEKLPFVNKPGDQRNISFSVGQNIYTPADIKRNDLIKDDRPYAGVSYLAFGLHSKSALQMDTLEFDMGIIGRHSFAEDSQKIFHKRIDSAEPKGWEHQLHDEPILNIFFERKWRLLRTKYTNGLGADFIPHIGIHIGNAFTGANMGAQVRFGWNIPNDFGTYLIRPGSDSNAPIDGDDPRFFSTFRRFGLHIFFAVDGNAVARNIFLDGNTFGDSHSVNKKPFVADLIGGIGMIFHRVKITYSYVCRTKEFETQKEDQRFAAISFSLTF